MNIHIQRLIKRIAIITGMSIFPAMALASPTDANTNSRTCPDAKVFSSKIVTDVCWGCIFPIKIAGAQVGSGRTPEGAADRSVCSCLLEDGSGDLVGVGVGYWEPARLIELVREPGCAPSLGGIRLPGSNKRGWGTNGTGDRDTSDGSFYHYRYYAFPLMLLLELYTPGGCFSDGMMDFDIMYISELDPTWNNDELAFFTAPEAAAIANLAAQSACTIDSAATAAGRNLDQMWWCAGSWGSLYPLSGKARSVGMPQATSLLSARAVAALHRRGLALRTMGNDAMCRSEIEPMLPKSQYRMNMFFPVAEAKSNHVIGETVLNWGLGKTIPVAGEDAVYMLWRWNDCCSGIY